MKWHRHRPGIPCVRCPLALREGEVCVSSPTMKSGPVRGRFPVALPLWLPAFAGMTVVCGNDVGVRVVYLPLPPPDGGGENGVLGFSLGSRVRGNDGCMWE